MKDGNLAILTAVQRALNDIPVRGYQNINMMLGVMQALGQVIKDEESTPEGEVKNDGNPAQ